MLRGVKYWKDVGKVTEVNGKPELDIWTEDQCNEFNGTDSTIFAPLLTEQDDIVSFSPDICRSLSARFDRKTKVAGEFLEKYKTANLYSNSYVYDYELKGWNVSKKERVGSRIKYRNE